MLVICAYHAGNLVRTQTLLRWMKELDSHLNHDLLLIAATTVTEPDIQVTHTLGSDAFKTVASIRQKVRDERPWPRATNSLFRLANEWLKQSGRTTPWLWHESDMIPMCSGWLDRLEHDYKLQGRPVYGTIYANPRPHINGGAIYPSNLAGINAWMVSADQLPFDMVRPEVTIRKAYNSPLIQRMLADPNTNLPMTFPDGGSLNVIRQGALIFHGCKDMSLINRLRERNGLHGEPFVNGHATFGQKLKRIFKKSQPKTITIRRTGAIGDALAATCVANKLIEKGHKVVFQCGPVVQKVLKYCPGIKVTDDSKPCDLDLNGVYERIPPAQRASQHFSEIFVGEANKVLKENLTHWNSAPVMKVPKEKLLEPFRRKHESRPRPWAAIVPRSNSFLNRSIPDATWQVAAHHIKGTVFWLGTHNGPPSCVDLGCRDISDVIMAIGNMDLVVGPDTGTAHIASAMRIPQIVIEQASSPDVHLSEQTDWCKLSPENLTCLNCNHLECPIDKTEPPCTHLDPLLIASAVNRRLSANGVSCAIPIYRPSASMLNQCLIHVLPQVDEVIVCVDKAGKVPDDILRHPKIRVVHSRLHDSGYGKKCLTAVRHTVNPFILTINDDVNLDPDAVKRMLETMNADEKCAVVGHMLYYPGRKKLQHGGPYRRLGKMDLGWGHLHDVPPQITTVTEVPFVTGASCLIRRSAFYDVGGFDQNFKLYYEDTDFCLSVRKAGWKIYYTPFASGLHSEHSSTDIKVTPDVSEQVRVSKEIFARKWESYFEANDNKVLGDFDYLHK